MSLLAPLFLIGLGLLALPFWLHRLQTDDPERETFSTTMFLEQSQKRVRVKRQLQHILLMLMRLFFLALLVFAFAKPVLQMDAVSVLAPNDRKHIIVVDTTASMSAEGVFESAGAEVDEIISGASSGDLIQLYRFGPNLVPVTEAIYDQVAIRSAASQLEPLPVLGDIGTLMSAISRLDWTLPLDYQIHFVSDLQQTSLPDRYADLIPNLPAAANIEFNFYQVAASDIANWSIESVREEDSGLRVNVRGQGTPEQEISLNVWVNGVLAYQSQLLVPAAESGPARASLVIPVVEFDTGINDVRVGIDADDALAADNEFHLVVDQSPPEPVLLLTENPYAPAANYLSAVLSSVGEVSAASANYRAEVQTLADFDSRTLERYSWVLVDDIGSLNEALSEAISDYLKSGGALFAASGQRTASLTTLPLTNHEMSFVSLEQENRFQRIANLDQSHPIINGLKGWTALGFSRVLSIEPNAGDVVLAGLDDGTPVLLEQRRGQGSLVLLTSSLDNTWNNLPVQPLYVSLMAQIAAHLTSADNLRPQMVGGELFNLQEVSGDAAQLQDPQGRSVLTLGDTTRPGAQVLDQLGFYRVFSLSGETSIGVNMAATESDLTAISAVELLSWQESLGSEAAITEANSVSTLVTEPQRQQDFWFLVLCAAACLLLVESVFANRQLAKKSNRLRYGVT